MGPAGLAMAPGNPAQPRRCHIGDGSRGQQPLPKWPSNLASSLGSNVPLVPQAVPLPLIHPCSSFSFSCSSHYHVVYYEVFIFILFWMEAPRDELARSFLPDIPGPWDPARQVADAL